MAKRTLQVELNKFMNFIDLPSVSKQAFSKARQKVLPEAFVLLNDKLVNEFYSDNEILKFKGYRLLAIDGSTAELPNSNEVIERFGRGKNQYGNFGALGRTSVLFDVLNKVTIHSKIVPLKISEGDLAVKHTDFSFAKAQKRFYHAKY